MTLQVSSTWKKILGVSAIVIFILLIVGGAYWVYRSSKIDIAEYTKKVEAIQAEKKLLEAVYKDTQRKVDSLSAIIAADTVHLAKTETVIKTINSDYDKEVKRVNDLPADSSLLFFKGWVPEENTTP